MLRCLARWAAVGVLLAGCSEDPCAGDPCGTGGVCDPGDGQCFVGDLDGPPCALGAWGDDDAFCVPTLPAAVCTDGTAWSAGTRAFREATDDWQLAGVEGVKMSVTDIDGDGWADLEVRRGALAVDDFDGTRRTWLLRNRGDGTFEDVTEASGFLRRRNEEPGTGRPVDLVAWADVDNDGDLDVYHGLATADWDAVGREVSELLLNDGAGNFTFAAEDSELRRSEDVDSPAGAAFVDVDHDGFVDLWTPHHNYTPVGTRSIVYQQDRLFRGDGSGRFVEITAEAGLTTSEWTGNEPLNAGEAHTRAWSGAACDLNGDGYAELLAASYGRSPNHLWQAMPGSSPSFENRSVASGYAFDADGDYSRNQFYLCYCQMCPSGDGCFDAPRPQVGCPPPLNASRPCDGSANWVQSRDSQPWRLGGNSGSTLCGDLDNDGDLDLVTGEIRHWWAGAGSDGGEVLINGGGDRPTFTRPGDDALGIAVDHSGEVTWDEGHMTGALLDFDNDGRLDLYVGASDYAGNRGRLYRNLGGLRFEEVMPADGIDHNRSHGVVAADFDRDGDLDLIVGHNSRSRCDASAPNNCYETSQVRFFENVLGDGGNFLQLKLEGGEGTNRAAIGARVTVTAGGVTQVQEVDGGHGLYGTQRDLVLHFGLGSACEAEVEVRWPDRDLTVERFTVPAGHRFAVQQGAPPTVAR